MPKPPLPDHLQEVLTKPNPAIVGTSWYRHITLHGTATLKDDPDREDIDRIARHYTGNAYANRDDGRVNAWIEVESWHAWNGGRPWT